ncbi:MAG: monovalent cation/H+ antiporter complex subunit F [Opitutales bacterium]
MEIFFIVSTVVLVAIILLPFYRVVRGPTVFDRLLAIGVMGAKTIGLVCLFGFLFNRFDMFVDIALAYAVLNFISGIAVAKYFTKGGKGEEG